VKTNYINYINLPWGFFLVAPGLKEKDRQLKKRKGHTMDIEIM